MTAARTDGIGGLTTAKTDGMGGLTGENRVGELRTAGQASTFEHPCADIGDIKYICQFSCQKTVSVVLERRNKFVAWYDRSDGDR